MSDLRIDLNKVLVQDRKLKPEDRKVVVAAREFEALMIQQLFKSMRETTKPAGIDGGSTMATYRDMMDEQVARDLSQGRGIGLSKAISQQLLGKHPQANELPVKNLPEEGEPLSLKFPSARPIVVLEAPNNDGSKEGP